MSSLLIYGGTLPSKSRLLLGFIAWDKPKLSMFISLLRRIPSTRGLWMCAFSLCLTIELDHFNSCKARKRILQPKLCMEMQWRIWSSCRTMRFIRWLASFLLSDLTRTEGEELFLVKELSVQCYTQTHHCESLVVLIVLAVVLYQSYIFSPLSSTYDLMLNYR